MKVRWPLLEILFLLGTIFGWYVPGMIVLFNRTSQRWPKPVSILFLLIHRRTWILLSRVWYGWCPWPIEDLWRFQSTFCEHLLPWFVIGAIGSIASTNINFLKHSICLFSLHDVSIYILIIAFYVRFSLLIYTDVYVWHSFMCISQNLIIVPTTVYFV